MARKHRRTSPQQQCGYIGESQLGIRFKQHGWEPGVIVPDTGEDYIVKILDDGYSSGLTFYAQVKSKYEERKLKNGGVGRRIEVKDLDEHWRDHVPPVFIFAWDVNKNIGYWISATDAIADLDHRRPHWRNQDTVEIRIPCSNKTDDKGLQQIRKRVAQWAEPIVAKGKEPKFTLKFDPNNPGECASREAMLRRADTGE